MKIFTFTHPEHGEIRGMVRSSGGRYYATGINVKVNGLPVQASGFSYKEAGNALTRKMAAADEAGTLTVGDD